jgi:Sigma-70 region 2
MSSSESERLDDVRPHAFAIAYRMLGSVSEAEDIVQEALVRIPQAIERGEEISSPRPTSSWPLDSAGKRKTRSPLSVARNRGSLLRRAGLSGLDSRPRFCHADATTCQNSRKLTQIAHDFSARYAAELSKFSCKIATFRR